MRSKWVTLFFYLLFILSVGTCFSQSNFQEGYIINLSNDTISGFIHNKVSLNNLKNCRFKTRLDSEFVDYSPKEIKAFRIYSSGYYVSLEIDIDGNKDIYFVEKLVEGIIDVFYYSAFNKGFFLIRTENGELYELKNTQIEVTTDEGSYTRHKKEYISMLRYLFKDSPSALKKVDQLPFESNAIIDIAQDYHKDVCTEYECIIYTKEKVKMKIDFGLYAGYSFSRTSFEGKYVKMFNGEFYESNDLLIGIFSNLMDPNISNKFSLQLDLAWQEGNYSSDSSSINISYLKIPLSVKYTYPGKKIKSSFLVGIAYNHWLNFKGQNLVPEYLSGEAIQTQRNQIGLHTGVEISYMFTKKLGIFFQGNFEYYSGKHFNYWTNDGLDFNEYVRSKTSFLSISSGLKF